MEDNVPAPFTKVEMLRSVEGPLPDAPSLPDGLTIRRAIIDDTAALAALCGRAYPNETWTTPDTEQELFHDNTVKAVLVVTDNTRILATASLQIHADSPHAAQLRGVATEQEMRRRGLAKALVVELLAETQRLGCREMFLKTTSDAEAAIAMYLGLEFAPIDSKSNEQIS